MRTKQRRTILTNNAPHKNLSGQISSPDVTPIGAIPIGDEDKCASFNNNQQSEDKTAHPTLSSSTSDQRPPKPTPHLHRSERKCIVSATLGTKDQLIRFVQDPEGRIMADLANKLPGRGVWVTPTYEMIEKAALKGGFARGFKVNNPPLYLDNFPAFIKDIQERQFSRCLEALGLARRAGDLVTGFDKVHETLKAEHRNGLVIIADDAGRDGTAKLIRLANHKNISVITCFSSAILSKALGFEQLGYAYITLYHKKPTETGNHETTPPKNKATTIGDKIFNEVIKYQNLTSPQTPIDTNPLG